MNKRKTDNLKILNKIQIKTKRKVGREK